MSFWIREIAGWLLVILGLLVCLLCVSILFGPAPMILQSGPLSLIGIIIFRGGIHLIKVSTAARVAMRVAKMEQSTSAAGIRRI